MIKIQLRFDGRVVSATLADTDAAHDFMAMLPLTLSLHDLFGREKFGALPDAPGAMSPATRRSRRCEAGDILCWPVGPDLSIVHRHDGKTVSGAFHVLGRIEAGAEALGVPGPLTVTIEAVAGEVGWGSPDRVRPASSRRPSLASSPAAPR